MQPSELRVRFAAFPDFGKEIQFALRVDRVMEIGGALVTVGQRTVNQSAAVGNHEGFVVLTVIRVRLAQFDGAAQPTAQFYQPVSAFYRGRRVLNQETDARLAVAEAQRAERIQERLMVVERGIQVAAVQLWLNFPGGCRYPGQHLSSGSRDIAQVFVV
jgi:hypothetical protein